MDKISKSQYKYTKGEMEINRAFKMQEMELSDLDDATTRLSQSVSDLRSDISQTTDSLTDLTQKIQQLNVDCCSKECCGA